MGLVVASCILTFAAGRERKAQSSGPVLSESSGHFRQLVIHYEPSAKEMVFAVYRQLLPALESDVTVYAVCPDETAFQEFSRIVGAHACRVKPIIVGHPITTWSRDRWLALEPGTGQRITTLWTPHGETGAQIWPARAGDERVACDIAAVLGGKVVARRSRLYFDAGDFFADSDNVLVTERVLRRNLQQTVGTRQELIETVRAELKKPVILLKESPDHHAAMFMVSVGKNTVLVGDPGLGKALLPPSWSARPDILTGGPWQADFSDATQRLFDAVAAETAAAGYNVVRIPTIAGQDGKSYVTYVNVLMDHQGERQIVYLPFYAGLDQLNAVARQAWEALGFEVRPIDCTKTFRHFGCLHCLVNVLARSP